jgi:hypothetical protein
MKFLLVILTFCSFTAFAQNGDEDIKTTINNLFDGMRKSDTALIRSAFAPNSVLQTIVKTKDGQTRVRTEAVDSFIMSIARPHKEVYDERITFGTIKVDADLAIVWTPYQFFVDDKFSHCGVNSFQLVKFNGQWKIQYLIDTRRRTNCL